MTERSFGGAAYLWCMEEISRPRVLVGEEEELKWRLKQEMSVEERKDG